MNTEINFLEKQPNKFTPFIKFGIICVILILCVSVLIFFQKNNLQTQIEVKANKLDQLEVKLEKSQASLVDEQKLKQLNSAIQTIKSTGIPLVSLYQNVLGLLPNTKQLVLYETSEANQIIVAANFNTLPDVASYVSALLKQNYITETELTSVILTESVYLATLTISIDPETLVKELGSNE